MAVSGKAKTADLDSAREAYRQGDSLRRIGGRCGVSKSTVCRWAKRYGWERAGEEADGDGGACFPGEEERLALEAVRRGAGQEGFSPEYALVRAMTVRLIDRTMELLRRKEVSVSDMRSICSMLKDARVLLGSLTPLETAEREMDLKAVKNRVEPPERGPVEVIFVGETERCSR